jgi:hypothetical protein
MSGIKFSDFGRSQLSAQILAATPVPFTMSLVNGARFVAYGAGDYEYLALKDASNNVEVIKVDSRTGNAFHVVARALNGTTARDWAIGDLCEAVLTNLGLQALVHDAAWTGTTTADALVVAGAVTAETVNAEVINETHGTNIASAATINLETADGNVVDVTGTTTITAITLAEGHERTVRFTGALTLTNGANLVLNDAPVGVGSNVKTRAGDFARFRGYAAGVVRMEYFSRGYWALWASPNTATVDVLAYPDGNYQAILDHSVHVPFQITNAIDFALWTAGTLLSDNTDYIFLYGSASSNVRVQVDRSGGSPTSTLFSTGFGSNFTQIYRWID